LGVFLSFLSIVSLRRRKERCQICSKKGEEAREKIIGEESSRGTNTGEI
jgi:hypothetical protein